MLNFQCILSLQSQSIDFKNAFDQSDIPSGEPVFIELPMDFNSDGEKVDVVLVLKKRLYGQAACLWYEKLRNCLLERGFVMSKVDPYLFMSNTVICVVYVDDCLFWAHSQSVIGNVINSFKGGFHFINGNTQRGNKCLSYFALISRHLMMVDLKKIKMD